MDATRCPKCNKRLIEEADDAGRIELRCLNCDTVDPLKTEAAKWAESSLAQPPGS
jgi:phage FluMu protein Com